MAPTEPVCAAVTAAAVAVSELMSEACFDSFGFFAGCCPCDAGVSGVSADDPVECCLSTSVQPKTILLPIRLLSI